MVFEYDFKNLTNKMKKKIKQDESESEIHSVVSDSLQLQGLYSPWNHPGQNTGVVSLSLLQGIVPNPEVEPRSPALQADSLQTEDDIKISFYTAKEISKVKRQSMGWGKY